MQILFIATQTDQKSIQKATKYKLTNKFNLFITEEQRNHIEQMAEMKKTTASNYVRDLLEKEIIKN